MIWECPNVWDFVFLAFRFEMPFHPKSILWEPLTKYLFTDKHFISVVTFTNKQLFGCYFDKS